MMPDKSNPPGRPPTTPNSSVRDIVSWLEKSKPGTGEIERDTGSGRERGRGNFSRTTPTASHASVGSSIQASPTVPASLARPAHTPSPRWPPGNYSCVIPAAAAADATPPPSTKKDDQTKTADFTTSPGPDEIDFKSPTMTPSTPQPPSRPVDRTLFLRNASQMQTIDPGTKIGSCALPTTPSTPAQQGSVVHDGAYCEHDRPATPTQTPYTPNHAPSYAPIYTPEDYSLEVQQYPVDAGPPVLGAPPSADSSSLAAKLALGGDRQTHSAREGQTEFGQEGGGSNEEKKMTDTIVMHLKRQASQKGQRKEAADTDNSATSSELACPVFRDPRVAEAFWTPVRQYLFVTDEELYDS